MTMQYDVKNAHLNASGSLVAYPVRIKGMVITSTGGSPGSVLLKDGGTGGTTLLEVDVPATAAFHNVIIPGEGIRFTTDVYAALTNCYISVFYG